MRTSSIRLLTLLAAATLASSVAAQPAASALAPTGTLRAVFLGLNPVQGHIDTRTGVASGPVPDLVEAIAKRIGVPFAVISAPNAAGVVSALAGGRADIGFLAYDAARARDVDFGAPFLVMLNSYLVRADSPIHTTADVDRPGVTVAAVRGQTQELFVSSHLKNAKVRVFEAMPSQPQVEQLLVGREVDAFAINRQRSLDAQRDSQQRLRALDDSFLAVDQAVVVAKGDAVRLPLVNRLIDEIKSSGFVKTSIERAGLVGVEVGSK